MKELSELQKKQLADLGVITLYLFGSRAQGTEHALSDFDFAILLNNRAQKEDRVDLYDKIYDILSPLCPRTLQNDIIDIVFLDSVGLELRMHVVRYGQILFDAQPKQHLKFEEDTIEQYCDFKPLLNIFDQAVLAAI